MQRLVYPVLISICLFWVYIPPIPRHGEVYFDLSTPVIGRENIRISRHILVGWFELKRFLSQEISP